MTSFGRALAATLLLAVMWLAGSTRPAAALGATCTFSGPLLALGTLSPFSGFPASVGGSMGISCINPNATSVTVYLCLSIASGPTILLATGSSTQLTAQVTGGATWPSVIGDGTTSPMEGPIALSIPAIGIYSGSLPLAVSVPDPGVVPQPGAYISVFAGTDSQVFYQTGGTLPASCPALLSGVHATAPAGFTIAATVQTQCSVAASPLGFPTRSLLNSPTVASATITTTCNASVPVTIALDNGATGTGPTARVMRSGLSSILYGIYRDSGLTQPWGATTGFTASVTGSGTLTAYGQVPAQASVPPGFYTDVVNVMITY